MRATTATPLANQHQHTACSQVRGRRVRAGVGRGGAGPRDQLRAEHGRHGVGHGHDAAAPGCVGGCVVRSGPAASCATTSEPPMQACLYTQAARLPCTTRIALPPLPLTTLSPPHHHLSAGTAAFQQLWDRISHSAACTCASALPAVRADHAALSAPPESTFEVRRLPPCLVNQWCCPIF